MEIIMLIGIPGSGKTTFYCQNFINSHIRISNDLLKTKNRENLLIEYCWKTEMPFVIDNTNSTRKTRAVYISMIHKLQSTITGYYIKTDIKQAIERNSQRIGKDRIPDIGILSHYKQLELPNYHEGFDKLFYVDITTNGFTIKEWKDEV